MPVLSIVIPCYNEAENIPLLIKSIDGNYKPDTEIILVDNGSTDDTPAVLLKELKAVSNASIRFVRVENNIGYGHGIMAGVHEARGEIIAWTHADMQTDPADVIAAYKNYINVEGFEDSILKGKRIGRNPLDAFFTFGMGVLSSLLMSVKLSDINGQPKMFHRSFLEKITNAPDDFSLDLYFLYQARVNGYEILEEPVHYGKRLHGEAKGGGSLIGKWKLIKRTWTYMNELKKKLDK
jgi:glycosyltransferase involved in cell wall biosynthesis